VENAARNEPGGDSEHVEIAQRLDFKAGVEKLFSEAGPGVPPEMVEGTPPREGIDDPLVIVSRFGNRFELGAGV